MVGPAGPGWAEGCREAALSGTYPQTDLWGKNFALLGGDIVLAGDGNDSEIRAGAIPIPHSTGWDLSLVPQTPQTGLGGK